MGPQADWSVVDALMLKTQAAAEKVARYKHAQLTAHSGTIGTPRFRTAHALALLLLSAAHR